MPSSVTLGAPVQQVDVLIAWNSDQSFALEFTDDQGVPDPPSGSVQLELADGTVWVGSTGQTTADAHVVTWTLTAPATAVDWSAQTVSTVRLSGTARVLIGAGTVRVIGRPHP